MLERQFLGVFAPLTIDHLLAELRAIEQRGGPSPSEYEKTHQLFDRIASTRAQFDHEHAVVGFRRDTPSFASTETMHGFVCRRPRGYAGDFEIIDRIYQHYHSDAAEHRRWDEFFHAGDAANAVRGRKDYAVALFQEIASRRPGVSILDVASGSCRDVLEFKSGGTEASSRAEFHCVDIDADAIQFARGLLVDHWNSVTFEKRNVFRLNPTATFDLIWCAGLFDYLDDAAAALLLKRLGRSLAPSSTMVIGNFGPNLRSRAYMEFGDWRLTYRTEQDLIELAKAAGLGNERLSVERETTGVNLFLRIEKGG